MKRFVSFIALALMMGVGVFAQSGKYGFIEYPVDGLYMVCSKDGSLWGVIDVTGHEVFPVKYETIVVVNDSTFVVGIDGKTGIMDANGGVVIPCMYETLWSSYDKTLFIANQNQVIDRNGKVLFTAAPGEEVLECNRDYIKVKEDEKFGIKTIDGKQVIPAVYDQVQLPGDGRIMVMKDGMVGYTDLKGNLVIPMIYVYYDAGDEDETGEVDYGFNEGLARVMNGEKFGYIDVNGKTVIPFKYSWTEGFQNGKAAVGIFNADGEYVTFKIDKTGKRLAEPAEYTEQDLKEGLSPFLIENAWEWGYKDTKTGKVRIPAKFNGASRFYNGYALVRIGDAICIIDKTGRVVLRNIADFSCFDAA